MSTISTSKQSALNEMRKTTESVQMAKNDETVNKTLPLLSQALESPGQSLEENTRSFMQSRLGHDFSHVRIHTDTRASAAAKSVGAIACTWGKDVFFATNEYRPWSIEGDRLIAHELTHVIQQDNADRPGTFEATNPSEVAETQAEAASTVIVQNETSPVISHGPMKIARQDRPSARAASQPSGQGRAPDMVRNGYHSFYLRSIIPGRNTEVRVQFYQDPSGRGDATFAVSYAETGTMRRVSFTPRGPIRPTVLLEKLGVVSFDIDGDGIPDITLVARANRQTLGVDFSAEMGGGGFFTMATTPPAPPSNYVPGRGIYMGQLPDGRAYYMVPGSTSLPSGPIFVDDRNQAVNPALEAQGAGTVRALTQGYLIGYGVLLAIAAAYALVGVVAAEGATAGVAAEAGVTATTRQALIAALRAAGTRFTESAIVNITRTIAGRVVWLETGTAESGLTHIMARHGAQFAAWGLRSGQQVAQVLIETLGAEAPVATGTAGAFDFSVSVGGVTRLLRIVIGSNGYIVTAFPL